MAAMDAVYPAARNAMAFPHLVTTEGLAPWECNQMYLFFTDNPNAWVDISDTIDTKIAALRAHTSQLRKPEELEGMLRGWAKENGEQIGAAAAERFRWVKLD